MLSYKVIIGIPDGQALIEAVEYFIMVGESDYCGGRTGYTMRVEL